MPWDYEETVRIDAEDILDYVKDNKDWFLDKLGEDDFVYKKKMKELSQVIHDMCNDEFDFLRKVRDGTSKLSDKEIIEKLGFNCDLFCSLTQPGNIVGAFSKEMEKQVGFTAEVVLPATHDTASAVLSAPLYGKTPYISSGTWSLLGVENNVAECGKVAMDCSYSNEGSIGFNFRLQKNIMGLWMIQQVRKELDNKYSFEELALLAKENVNESEIDVNSPRYLMPKSMIEEICKEVGKTLSVGEIAYCIFNNLAKDYARSLDNLQQITGKQYDSLNIIGGGSKNELLNELTAKYTGKKVITGPTEGTALGNLLMQMLGTKQFADIYEGRQIIRNSFDLGIYGK